MFCYMSYQIRYSKKKEEILMGLCMVFFYGHFAISLNRDEIVKFYALFPCHEESNIKYTAQCIINKQKMHLRPIYICVMVTIYISYSALTLITSLTPILKKCQNMRQKTKTTHFLSFFSNLGLKDQY